MVNNTELNRLADMYRGQGYDIVVRPMAGDLPPIAKDFRVELLGRKGARGALVSVKKNRSELAADQELTRDAATTRDHLGWRFDFAMQCKPWGAGAIVYCPEKPAFGSFSGLETMYPSSKMAKGSAHWNWSATAGNLDDR